MRVSRDEFEQYLRSLHKDTLIGGLAHALLDSKMPFPLAIRMLGCSRSTFYSWLRLEKRVAQTYVTDVEKLTRALLRAHRAGETPCTTDADYVRVLIAAISSDNNIQL